MKKVFMLMMVMGLALSSQGQRFEGGVMLGLAATQIDGDNLGGYNKPGIRGGGWVNTPVSGNLILQLELEFLQKGSKISEQELNSKQYYHARLNYLQAPVLVKTSLMDRLTGEAGIAGSYLFTSVEDKDGYGVSEADPFFDRLELSGLIGLNYQLTANPTGQIRFNYSLLPVRPHPGDQYYWLDRGQYNNALLFSLYYKIEWNRTQ